MAHTYLIAAALTASLVGAEAMTSQHMTAYKNNSTADLEPLAPISCDFRATSMPGGGIILEPMLSAVEDISGSFRLQVVGSGSGNRTNIRQGGAFNLSANNDMVLGRMTLGSAGMVFDVDLEIDSDLGTFTCAQSVGGRA